MLKKIEREKKNTGSNILLESNKQIAAWIKEFVKQAEKIKDFQEIMLLNYTDKIENLKE
jgi:hypothetical protein